MKNRIVPVMIAFLLIYCFTSCNTGTSPDNNSISGDSVIIAKGKVSFLRDCSGCHNFKQDGIGPQLGGVTTEVSANWIQHFIRNPKEIIASKDPRAEKLFEKYKVTMPSFTTYTDDEIHELVAFLNTYKKPDQQLATGYGNELLNPVTDSIVTSNLIAGLQLITQIPASSDSGKLPLTRITKLGFQPNSSASFILDLRGKLYKLEHHNKLSIYMDMAKLEPKFINQPGLATGFGSFAFHPEFAKNGLLYTTHTEPPHSAKADFSLSDSIKVTLQWVLTEWKTAQPRAAKFTGEGRELFRVDMVSGIHGVQEITFNPTARKGSKDYGLLYIGIGDGGAVENGYPFLAHNKEKIWGTILRIDPMGNNSDNGQYGIPIDNPFTKSPSKTLSEIYAYGFRNPHRITWGKSGKMLACNIGHSNIESINIINPGNDYGWPIREGTFVVNPYADLSKIYPLPPDDSKYKITYPAAQYDHDEGKAISGGFEYLGSALPQLAGKYLFGDIPTGRLFYVNMNDLKLGRQAIIKEWKVSFKGVQKTLSELCGSERVDLHFGRDYQGELYILTKADGKVYKLINAIADSPVKL